MKRRHFIQGLASLPLLPGIFEAVYATQKAKKHLIILWMDGGMSHLDTFDPKPQASSDIRGPLDVVKSSLDGIPIVEPLKDLGKVMDRCCLVRSITSPEGNHDRGSHYMLTGRRPTSVITYPSIGSLIAREAYAESQVPPYVAIPESHAYGHSGYLADRFSPFETGGEPSKSHFQVRDLKPRPETQKTLDMLAQLESIQGSSRSVDEREFQAFRKQSGDLSLNPEVNGLFDLNQESNAVRARYGRHKMGQSFLLARRLVEGGVRVVLVRDKGWDHHVNINSALTYGFPSKLDGLNQALTQLILDLDQRGLSEKVSVMLASEFGRTPRLNPSGGRDHWSRASCSLLFGSGIQRGRVIGKTDSRGEEPAENPVSPADLFATLLTSMGLNADERLTSPDGRPIPIIDPGAKVIDDIIS